MVFSYVGIWSIPTVSSRAEKDRAESTMGTNGLRKLALAGLVVSIVSVLISLAVLVILIRR